MDAPGKKQGRAGAGETRRDVLRAGTGLAAVTAGTLPGSKVGAVRQESGTDRLVETARLSAPAEGANAFDLFGFSVDADGDRVLVGAPQHDGAAENAGAAYLFETDGDGWSLRRQFDAGGDARSAARFGQAVAIDGTTILVGAGADSEAGVDAGAAYVFEAGGDEWTRAQRLPTPRYDEEWRLGPTFGWRVDLEGDRAVIAAPGESNFDTANGAVYVYERDAGGTWRNRETLYPGDSPIAHPYYLAEFGQGVALDGDRVLVGAPGDSEADPDAGAAYVFDREGDGWHRRRKLLAEEPRANELFGSAVALDGDRALVGAPQGRIAQGHESYGTAHLYEYDGGEWTAGRRFVADEGAPDGRFGAAVALDGDRAIITRPNAREEEGETAAAYVFDRVEGSWTESQRLAPGDPEAATLFGYTAVLEGQRAVCADVLHDGSVEQSGAAYVFEPGEPSTEEPSTESPTEPSTEDGPGFGALGALAAFGVIALRRLRTARDRSDSTPETPKQ